MKVSEYGVDEFPISLRMFSQSKSHVLEFTLERDSFACYELKGPAGLRYGFEEENWDIEEVMLEAIVRHFGTSAKKVKKPKTTQEFRPRARRLFLRNKK